MEENHKVRREETKMKKSCENCFYKARVAEKPPCNRCFNGSNWSEESLV